MCNISTAMKIDKIIQFSPPRSGSTLVYNILCEVFPHADVMKHHSHNCIHFDIPVVSTYRNPLDCIASLINCNNLPTTDEVINDKIIELNNNGIFDIMNIHNNKNVLVFKYEEIVSDFGLIFDGIEEFFGVGISTGIRTNLCDKYNIINVKNRIRDMSDFSKYDTLTQWHGNHISKYMGDSCYIDMFNTKQINHMYDVYSEFLNEFKYV